MKGFNEALHDAVYAANSSIASVAKEAGITSCSLYHIIGSPQSGRRLRARNAEKLMQILAEEFTAMIEKRRGEIERLQDARDALVDSYIAEYMNGAKK